MAKPQEKIRFTAKLLRPANPKGATWAFLVLPADASAKLPTRSMLSVDGMLEDQHFKSTLSPDGEGSHWLKVPKSLREAAKVNVGEMVTVDVAPLAVEPVARVPADLRNALAAHADAKLQWDELTPVARRDWIQWIVTAKQAETRARRIRNSCDMLVSGKRRVCCFDRSGMYSKAITAPTAAE